MCVCPKIRAVAVACALLMAAALPAETLVWTGAASSDWNLTDVNWTNELGEATAWVNGSSATFAVDAESNISVTDDIQLQNLLMTAGCSAIYWKDGGGSLTFVSDAANPTNYITPFKDGQHYELQVPVNCAGTLVKDGGGVIRLYNGGNNLTGGVVVTKSQLRYGSSGSIGPGTVTVLGNATLFNDDVAAPDVKFIQSDQSFMGSTGPRLTIKGVGVTTDNVARKFGIGRSNDYNCRITLALTDPESEGIGQYVVRGGGMNLTFDGGTVKACPKTPDVFFNATGNMNPVARVTNNGVTFDTAGASTELGLSLAFDGPAAITNVAETVEPQNGSFETGGFSPWSIEKGQQPGETSGVNANGSAFTNDGAGNAMPDYYTTNGTKFAVLRRGHTMSQTVNLPAAGLWRVVYERGCRPNGTYPSHLRTVTVSLGGQSTISPPQSTMYPFRREETALFELEAGAQALSFSVDPGGGQNVGVFLDAIRLERCELTPVSVGSFVKTGVGSLAVTNLVTDGRVAVSNGTLTVRKTTLDGTPVEVAAGGTLELYATTLTNATVNVASGGTLRLRDGDGRNFVVNGSFEDNKLAAAEFQSYTASSRPRGWTMSYDVHSDIPGIQANGSGMSNRGPETEYGRTTAYLRQQARLQQTVTVPADGTYEVSFMHACRSGYNSYTIPLTCLIDGVAVASNGTRTANYGFERSTARVNLTAGGHTLMFSTGSSSVQYAALFIDDVRVVSTAGTNALDGNALAFAPGATLDLQNADLVYIAGGVTVDGRVVKGTTNTLRHAGLTVTGCGEIQIGPPQGTMIQIR